jgi:hypothetical protein
MKRPEQELQIAVANYIRLQYPKAMFCHIPNERKTSHHQGKILKEMGVLSGMPDVMIFRKFLKLHLDHDPPSVQFSPGLAIELKIKYNKPSEAQLEILAELKAQGWITDVCYDFESTKKRIDQYMKASNY